MKQIPFVFRDEKVLFFHKALPGETQEFCNPSILVWGVNPNKYAYNNGVVTPVTKEESDSIDQSINDTVNSEISRVSEIKNARETGDLKKVTVTQAETVINNLLDTSDLDALLPDYDAATDFATIKAVIRDILIELRKLHIANKNVHLKEVPYILD